MIHIINKKDNRFIFEFILFILIFNLQPFNISAQNEIPDSIVKERIRCIQNILEQGRTNANHWYYGWLAGYSAATLGQGTVCFISKDNMTRENMALGAATTCLGAIGQLLTPMGRAKKLISLLKFLIQHNRKASKNFLKPKNCLNLPLSERNLEDPGKFMH